MKKHIIATILFLLAFGLLACHAQGPRWLEIPSGSFPEGTIVTTQSFGAERSHTFVYDPALRVSLCVAYPLNADLIGEGSRGDGWEPYPAIAETMQPILYKGFRYGSGYDRGHQIPSADRLRPEQNASTFVFVNATPQKHDFNGGIWAELEKVIRTWAKRSDTLYVVTGVVPGKDWIPDNIGSGVNIPAAYWKAVLRRSLDKAGNTRWSMCAVYLPHRELEVRTWQENLLLFKTQSLSIDALEEKIGYDLFPYFADVVGKGAAAAMEAANPSEQQWWWK